MTVKLSKVKKSLKGKTLTLKLSFKDATTRKTVTVGGSARRPSRPDSRVAALDGLLEEAGLDAVLATKDGSIAFLSGFWACSSTAYSASSSSAAAREH